MERGPSGPLSICNMARKQVNQKIQRLLKRQDYICALCGREIRENHVPHVHHWIPVAKGGSNKMSNLYAVHDKCNMLVRDRYSTPELQKQCREIPVEELEHVQGICEDCGCDISHRHWTSRVCVKCKKRRNIEASYKVYGGHEAYNEASMRAHRKRRSTPEGRRASNEASQKLRATLEGRQKANDASQEWRDVMRESGAHVKSTQRTRGIIAWLAKHRNQTAKATQPQGVNSMTRDELRAYWIENPDSNWNPRNKDQRKERVFPNGIPKI